MKLFPSWCYHCHRFITEPCLSENKFLCQICIDALPFQKKDVCTRCGLEHESIMCNSDWAKEISSFHAIFKHSPPIHQWISSLKYSRNLITGNILLYFVNNWFVQNQQLLEEIDCIVPIPLHVNRLRSRGFNQSVFLLKQQCSSLVKLNRIRRVRNTPHQAGLSKKERDKNLRKAFQVSGSIKGKNIMLFDDVCTSG